MNQAEEFERSTLGAADGYGPEPGRNGGGRKDLAGAGTRTVQSAREPLSRPLGAPLPAGNGLRSSPGSVQEEGLPVRQGTPPGRSLSPRPDPDAAAGAHWVAGVVKQAMPFMQRLLPLIDANLATALSNLVSNRPPSPPPAPRIDLQPIETGLAELQGQQKDLRTQILEHNTSLKRVEDQLEMVREATDRNTLEQQELIEDLKNMGSKVNLFALTLLALLVLSVALNLFLFLHIQRVLP